MNNRRKVLLIASSFLVASLGLHGLYETSAQRYALMPVAHQSRTRMILTDSHIKLPVKISMVKVKNRKVDSGKEFDEDDDWLRGLTVQVTNKSNTAVTSIHLELVFPRSKDEPTGVAAAWPLRKGVDPFISEFTNEADSVEVELAPPGGQLELALSDMQYEQIVEFLQENNFPFPPKRLEIQVLTIGFADGTAWNGRMYRKDPTYSDGPLKGWRPLVKLQSKVLETNRNIPPGTRFANHAGTRGTALQKIINVSRSGRSPRPALRYVSPTIQTQVQCGEFFRVGRGCGNAPPEVGCFYDSGEMILNGTRDATVPSVKPCIFVRNGVEFSCGASVPTSARVACPTPPPRGACNGDADWISYPFSGCITGLIFGGPCTRSSTFQSRCLEPTGYEQDTCSCPDGTSTSPIVIDVDHSGFSLTDTDNGVVFKIMNDGAG